MEVTELEVRQDQFKAQMPSHNQAPQEESPEERECAHVIAYLAQHGGNTAHSQQLINEFQDKYLRLAAERSRSRPVQEDSLEHGLPEDVPWPLDAGSPIRQTLITQGSIGTQRHVAQYVQSKGNSAKGKGKGRRADTGKNSEAHSPGPQDTPAADNPSSENTPAPAATTSTPPAPSSSTSTPPDTNASQIPTPAESEAAPPWRTADTGQPSEMEDTHGPERGEKRSAASVDAPAKQQGEEDEFQEALRYRRGDGHLV
jgi:hypothetical protein